MTQPDPDTLVGALTDAVREQPYGDQVAAELADTLASLVGQLLATVSRDDVDDALATNIARNLGAAAEQWARQATLPPSARLGMVADAVAEG